MNSPVVQSGWKFAKAETQALELEALLRKHGVSIVSGSMFETHVLRVLDVAHAHSTGAPLTGDVRASFRSLIGVSELARLILGVEDNPSFKALLPHLRLLNESNALQMERSSVTDAAANKLFELMIACIAMQCGTDVVLDHPTSSAGDNPDVLATIGGRRWGFACKALHSDHPEGFIEHVRKGVDQIQRSEAEIGVVVFNLKNVIESDTIWPLDPSNTEEPYAWPDYQSAFAIFCHEMDTIGRRLQAEVSDPVEGIKEALEGSKSVRAVLLWGHAATGAIIDGMRYPTSVRCLKAVTYGKIPPDVQQVLECFNWSAFSDSPDRGSRPSV